MLNEFLITTWCCSLNANCFPFLNFKLYSVSLLMSWLVNYIQQLQLEILVISFHSLTFQCLRAPSRLKVFFLLFWQSVEVWSRFVKTFSVFDYLSELLNRILKWRLDRYCMMYYPGFGYRFLQFLGTWWKESSGFLSSSICVKYFEFILEGDIFICHCHIGCQWT